MRALRERAAARRAAGAVRLRAADTRKRAGLQREGEPSRPSFCAHANLRPTPTNTATIDAATLCLIDQVRDTNHLRPLRTNHELQGRGHETLVGAW